MPTLLLRESGLLRESARTWSRFAACASLAAAVAGATVLIAARPRPAARPGGAAPGPLLRTPAGRIPRLRHLDRPEPVGARPARDLPGEGRPGQGRAGRSGPAEAGRTEAHRGRDFAATPAYVERDAGAQLRAALSRPGFVLVVGEPLAGRTRLAYETARALHPRHALVRPLDRSALPEAVRVAGRRRRAVLWLDDLEDFLGAAGLTTAQLDAMRRVVVVATMRTEEYVRYGSREASRLVGSDQDAWRDGRDLLRRAVVVRLDRPWSPAERHRAGGHRGDPRIAAALGAGERFGVAEALAGGPGLPARWEGGWAAGARPRGAAVVAAAVDCRRAGLRRPVAGEWLRALHPPYLAARGGAALRPESFAEALDWARAAEGATGALLTGGRARGYTACGRLLDAPGLGPVPDHLWQGLLALAGAEDAYDMGLVAHQEARPGRAVLAFTRARSGGVTEAELPLALAVGDAGRPRRAAADLAGIARRRELRLGPRHPATLAARHQLAHFTGEAGDARAAAARFATLVADTRAALGPGHPDTLAARHQLAYFTGVAGDPRSAARQLESLLAERLALHGPDHPHVLAARRGLIWFRAPQGCSAAGTAEAERQTAALRADAERVLGPRDPHTLAVRATGAALAARAGRSAEAVRSWAALVADRTAVLGEEHPHALHSRLEWARALIAEGRRQEARDLLVGTLAVAGRSLEPGHRHLRLARELGAAVTAAEPGPP
ncbi:tetratricopeptide repeat protein [Streptomyces sp. NPDC058646]|uniref:tetratricopeptide repeat protein n=1 Tax=Streptomyces sp. NPDC058646 TaxID=3346574 RepID=UPI003667F395